MEKLVLEGKVALITGSSRGLGRAYAQRLAKAGAEVIITDETDTAAAQFGEAPSGEAVAEEIRALGRKSAFYAADLTDPNQVSQLVEKVLNDFGHIDILVNNAGGDIGAKVPRPDPNNCLDIKDEDIKSVVDRNLLTTMYVSKYVGRHMRERKAGKIVNISSIAGYIPCREGIIYGAAKLGVAQYTRCLAEELKEYGINANCIAPVGVRTARFLATRSAANEDHLPRLQRSATADDVANMVLFLVGPESDRLTGETIRWW